MLRFTKRVWMAWSAECELIFCRSLQTPVYQHQSTRPFLETSVNQSTASHLPTQTQANSKSSLVYLSGSSPGLEKGNPCSPPPLPPKQRNLQNRKISLSLGLGPQLAKSPSYSPKGSVYSMQSIPIPKHAFQDYEKYSVSSSISDISSSSVSSSVQQKSCPSSSASKVTIVYRRSGRKYYYSWRPALKSNMDYQKLPCLIKDTSPLRHVGHK